MDVIKTKKLIEGIIEDLSNNIAITSVFNKVQILASYLNNDAFTLWVKNERMGYNDVHQLPEYRKTNVDILVDGISGGYSLTNFPIPNGIFGNDGIEKIMRTYNCFDKISNLEPFKNEPEGCTNIVLPVIAYSELKKIFPYGEIHVAYHRIPNLFFAGVVDAVNSKLLDFLLEINKEMEIDADFNTINKKQYIDNVANQTINAGVVNMGSGNITIENSQVMGGHGNNMPISSDLKEKIQEIIAEIEKIKVEDEADKNDIAEEIFAIKEELHKESPSKTLMKRSLRVLKTIGSIAQEKVIEHGIDQLLNSLPK
ncbi:MAG: hypothetical protein K5864_08025 [Bacteroidales bacterium]|nr:hypothetical protein [Bacteroidales bacterium]